jgi:hypothetical protein
MQKEGRPQIISGSKRGDLLWWDPRFPGEPTRRVQAHKLRTDDSMTAFEVHDYAPILATASPNSCIKVRFRPVALPLAHIIQRRATGEGLRNTFFCSTPQMFSLEGDLVHQYKHNNSFLGGMNGVMFWGAFRASPFLCIAHPHPVPAKYCRSHRTHGGALLPPAEAPLGCQQL